MEDTYVNVEAGALLLPSPPYADGDDVDLWTCIGLDPGGTTGWCVLSVYSEAMRSDEYRILENVAAWSAGEVTGSIGHQIDKLIELLDSWPEAEVVCEDFILRSMVMDRTVLDPVRITEPLKWWLERGGRRAWDAEEDGPDAWKPRVMHLQQPSLAMTSVTDDRLKDYGVYSLTAGKPHARDALRHALTFTRRRKAEMRVRV